MAGRRFIALTVSLLMMALLTGCGDRIATVPVSGSVTLANGSPVEGATVSMESLDHSTSATARTDAAGRFVMSTVELGDGMPIGSYRAVIMPPVPVDVDAPNPSVIDAKYGRYETSGLDFTIEGATDNLKIQLD